MDLKLKDNTNLKFNPVVELNYIQSHTNEYIDTGITANSNLKLEMEFEFTTVAGIVFGTRGANYNQYAFSLIPYSGVMYTFYVGTQSSTNATLTAGTRYYASCKQGAILLTNVDTSETLINSTKGYNSYNSNHIFLFGSNSNSGVIGRSSIKLYYCKMYNGNTLVRDFVPSYNNAQCCLYDKVTKAYFYNLGGSAFTSGGLKANSNDNSLVQSITSLYVKDCPLISGYGLFSRAIFSQESLQNKLNRVRIDVGNYTSTMKELYDYSRLNLNGFNDNYENQVKPRFVGTWTINNYWCNNELDTLENTFDGLTIVTDNTLNIDSMLENDECSIQTLDSTKPNYNPAVAIIMDTAGYSHRLQEPAIDGGGLFARPKNLTTSSTTQFRGKTTVVDTNGIVSDDTTAEYDFENFDEFQYFQNTTITAGSSTSALGAFGGCTKLKKITFPSTLTTIGDYAFYNCTALEELVIPNTVTSIGNFAFVNCKFSNLYIPQNTNGKAITDSGNNNNPGILYIKGNYEVSDVNISTGNTTGNTLNYNTIIIEGNVTNGSTGSTRKTFTRSTYTHIARIKGTCAAMTNTAGYGFMRTNTARFIEFMSTTSGCLYTTEYQTNCIIHLGYNGLAAALSTFVKANVATHMSKIATIYVGDSSSKAADQAVFDLYNADTNWTTYCGSGVPGAGKVDLWWNYNGEYKWYYITDNLVNCSNNNPDAWPHITRGESYETVLVPDEGYSLQNSHVTIEMLDTDTTSPTYDTMVDVTADCTLGYFPGTGEVVIQIPSVTGNVVITASAS